MPLTLRDSNDFCFVSVLGIFEIIFLNAQNKKEGQKGSYTSLTMTVVLIV